MRRVALVSIAVLVAALPAAVAPAATGPQAKASGAKKFNPQKIAGSWKGTWKNQTFSTKGPASMKLNKKGKQVIGTFDLGGNAFGCADPDPRKVTLKKGKGNNRWNNRGLKAVWNNGLGTNTLKLKLKKGKLKVSGKGTSPCTNVITYKYKGQIKRNKKLTADVEIFNNGAPLANSTLKMNKK